MRIKGWERALRLVVERHMALPSVYGISDCYLVADDAVEAITGERMYADACGYTTPLGAARKLRQHGFETVSDAFAARFAEIPVMAAQRGDIGVIHQPNGDVTGGVFTGAGFFTRSGDRAVFLPCTDVARAFRVE